MLFENTTKQPLSNSNRPAGNVRPQPVSKVAMPANRPAVAPAQRPVPPQVKITGKPPVPQGPAAHTAASAIKPALTQQAVTGWPGNKQLLQQAVVNNLKKKMAVSSTPGQVAAIIKRLQVKPVIKNGLNKKPLQALSPKNAVTGWPGKKKAVGPLQPKPAGVLPAKKITRGWGSKNRFYKGIPAVVNKTVGLRPGIKAGSVPGKKINAQTVVGWRRQWPNSKPGYAVPLPSGTVAGKRGWPHYRRYGVPGGYNAPIPTLPGQVPGGGSASSGPGVEPAAPAACGCNHAGTATAPPAQRWPFTPGVTSPLPEKNDQAPVDQVPSQTQPGAGTCHFCGSNSSGCATFARFSFNSAKLKAHHTVQLKELAAKIIAGNVNAVVAVGHTDTSGPEKYNDELGYRRSNTVVAELKKELNKLQLHSDRPVFWRIDSAGETQPEPNSNAANSRRVEICLKQMQQE